MRAVIVLLATSLVTSAAAAAQAPDSAAFAVRVAPGVLDGAETTFGLRYEIAAAPRVDYDMRSTFATRRSWNASLDGALALEPAVATEPLARGAVDLGARVLLRRVAACTPERCIPGDVGWDFGYALVGVRLAGEASQRAHEVEGAVGASLLYRPPPRATGLWPVVPGVALDYVIARPVRSELREAAGADLTAHRRFDVALDWHARLGHEGVPDAIARLRLEAEWRHFREHGRSQTQQALATSSGTFVAIGIGYDLTQRVRYVRDVFVRWSDGEHPTQKQQRRAWLVGITIEGD